MYASILSSILDTIKTAGAAQAGLGQGGAGGAFNAADQGAPMAGAMAGGGGNQPAYVAPFADLQPGYNKPVTQVPFAQLGEDQQPAQANKNPAYGKQFREVQAFAPLSGHLEDQIRPIIKKRRA